MEYSSDPNRISIGERISNSLRALYPASAAKNIARDAGASQRTAESWLSGNAIPSLLHFAALCAKHPDLFVTLQPIVGWAEAAVSFVECDSLARKSAAAEAKRDEHAAKLRGLL